jgi:hypothetical protein
MSISVWPGGYQIVFWAGLAFATLIAFGCSNEGKLWDRVIFFVLSYFIAVPITVGMISFLSGLGLLLWKLYVHLKFGQWPAFSVAHVLYVLDAKLGQGTGWIGLDQIQASLLDASALAALLAILPVLSILGLFLSVYVISRIAKAAKW